MRRHVSLSCWISARQLVSLASIAAASSTLVLAQNSDANTYRLPPKALADLIDAPPTPGVSFSPDKTRMIIMDRPNMPPISELAQPELRLAGTRINPRTNGRSRGRHSIRLTIKDVADGRERIIAGIPDGSRIGIASWSPDGARIAGLGVVGSGQVGRAAQQLRDTLVQYFQRLLRGDAGRDSGLDASAPAPRACFRFAGPTPSTRRFRSCRPGGKLANSESRAAPPSARRVGGLGRPRPGRSNRG